MMTRILKNNDNGHDQGRKWRWMKISYRIMVKLPWRSCA